MDETKAFRLILTGKVQGLNLRRKLKELADDLGLAGQIENLPDGTVEVFIEGPVLPLTQFVNFCKQGSEASKLSSVQIFPIEISSKNSFEIIN